MLAKRRGPVGFEAATRPVLCPEEALIDRLGVRQVLETRVPLGIRQCKLDSNAYGPTRVAQTNPADESESIDRTNHAQTIEPLRRTTGSYSVLFPIFPASIETRRNYCYTHSYARNARDHSGRHRPRPYLGQGLP